VDPTIFGGVAVNPLLFILLLVVVLLHVHTRRVRL
jgi:hypothetical protein